MTINDAKQIKLADYLKSLGYTPIKQQGKSLWYKSPLRNETDASFKVNTELNQWYDFGVGKGGNIIALAAELYHSENVAYLLARIAERTPYIRPASFSFGEQKTHSSSFQGVQVGELSSSALIDYLRGRGINIELAKRECKELRYEYEGKTYFVVGFPNIAGGYELRNRYFKGLPCSKGYYPYPTAGRATSSVLPLRGVYGLPLVSHHSGKRPPRRATHRGTGLYGTQLSHQPLKSGTTAKTIQQNRLFPRQRPGRANSNGESEKDVREQASRYVAPLRRTQGFERLLMPQKPNKTGREKIASPIRKTDATTAAEEETRLQVIAHYNYTLR